MDFHQIHHCQIKYDNNPRCSVLQTPGAALLQIISLWNSNNKKFWNVKDFHNYALCFSGSIELNWISGVKSHHFVFCASFIMENTRRLKQQRPACFTDGDAAGRSWSDRIQAHVMFPEVCLWSCPESIYHEFIKSDPKKSLMWCFPIFQSPVVMLIQSPFLISLPLLASLPEVFHQCRLLCKCVWKDKRGWCFQA